MAVQYNADGSFKRDKNSYIEQARAKAQKEQGYKSKPVQYNEDGSFKRSSDSAVSQAKKRDAQERYVGPNPTPTYYYHGPGWTPRNPKQEELYTKYKNSQYPGGSGISGVGGGNAGSTGGGAASSSNNYNYGTFAGGNNDHDMVAVDNGYANIANGEYNRGDTTNVVQGEGPDLATAIGTGLGLGAGAYGLYQQGGLPTYIQPVGGGVPGATGADGVYYARFPNQLPPGSAANGGQAVQAIPGNNYSQLGQGRSMIRYSNGMGGIPKLPAGAPNIGRFTGNVGPTVRAAAQAAEPIMQNAEGVAYTSPSNMIAGAPVAASVFPWGTAAGVGGAVAVPVAAGLYGADANIADIKQKLYQYDEDGNPVYIPD